MSNPSASPRVDSSPIANLSDEDQTEIARIMKILKRPQDLSDDDTWPFVNIMTFTNYLTPPNEKCRSIPLPLANALEFDFRNYDNELERVEHLSYYIDEESLNEWPRVWLKSLHNILCSLCGCRRPLTRSRLTPEFVSSCLEGLEMQDDGYYRGEVSQIQTPTPVRPGPEPLSTTTLPIDQSRSRPTPLHPDRPRTTNLPSMQTAPSKVHYRGPDLATSIKIMTSIFPADKRPTGEETEPFMHTLQPIIDQLKASNIPEEHQVTTTFTLLLGKARDVASSINLHEHTIESFVTALKSMLLHDHNIQQRKLNRWNTITFGYYRQRTATLHKAASSCLDTVFQHFKDLPPFMSHDQALLERLRSIFRNESWCLSLYEKASPTMTASEFAELLKTAASNFDQRNAIQTNQNTEKGHGTYPVDAQNTTISHHELGLLVNAFFAKTPPPPRFRRPHRFRRPFRRSWNPKIPRVLQNSSTSRRCWSCNQEGHFSRNCPQKNKYMQRLTNFRNAGSAAVMIMEFLNGNDDPNEQMDEVATYLNELDITDEDTNEFDTWISSFLDILDSHFDNSNATSAFHIKISVPELSQAMTELDSYPIFSVQSHLLLDTGAPKSICSIDWLKNSNWTPIATFPVSQQIKPFRFAGTAIRATHIAYLIARLTDTTGKSFLFRQVVFVLPPTPIPFLTGLDIARHLALNINIRDGNGSHILVSQWHATFPIVVQSHLWLPFEPVNDEVDPNFNWTALHKRATTVNASQSNFIDIAYVPPPWERDGYNSALNEKNIARLHDRLRHPTPASLIKLFKIQSFGTQLPAALKRKIQQVSDSCSSCAEHAELPRVPKLSLPPPAAPNIAVTLDVYHHVINHKQVSILVMLDVGDKLIRLHTLTDHTAQCAFNAYLWRWISIFDAPIFTVVDQGTNLTSDLMYRELRKYSSQLCPIPTEAPWSLGSNERSHKFLAKTINIICASPEYDVGPHYQSLLSDVEMAWNFTQHANRELPHFNRFGTMPRILGECPNLSIQQRIALMASSSAEIDHMRASQTLSRAFSPFHRYDTSLRLFQPNQKVWFYRRNHGWRPGLVISINRPTVSVRHGSHLYPTHENRVRPFFNETFIPPDISTNDSDEAELPSRNFDTSSDPNPSDTTPNRLSLPHILNHTYGALSEDPLCLNEMNVGIIDSDLSHLYPDTLVNITVVEPVKLNNLTGSHLTEMQKAIQEEIKFLLDNKVVERIPLSEVPNDSELQILKWVLQIKRNLLHPDKIRHRARLVSASNLSQFRHSLAGNAPTIALKTVRLLLSLAPSWDQSLRANNDMLNIKVRDVTKAYLQSNPTQRLIYYKPPKESLSDQNTVWKAIKQLYGEVEAGRYWYHTFVPWMCNNILDLKQSMYDPALLYNPTSTACFALCTDDVLSFLPRSQSHEEQKMAERFTCRDSQEIPTDFKGVDILRDGSNLSFSQDAYIDKLTLPKLPDINVKDQNRQVTDQEHKCLQTLAGKLAWIATCTSPLSAFSASVSLQRHREEPTIPLTLLYRTFDVLDSAKKTSITKLHYVPLDESTIHLRVYCDASFQNLRTKHSQIGFCIFTADGTNQVNLIHWHSSRAPRRGHSTEQTELMALDEALKSVEYVSKMLNDLMRKDIPVVVFIDCDTLWSNLMKETVPTIPEIGYRCREAITEERVHSMCLIKSSSNPADALTKAKANKSLQIAIDSNSLITPPHRVFMLQSSRFRHLSYIPTSTVPMPNDN